MSVILNLMLTFAAFRLEMITIPASAMGPDGPSRVTSVFSHARSVNRKTLHVRLGGGLVARS